MTEPPRTPEEAVRAYDDAFNRRDWDALADLVSPEMRVDDRRTGIPSLIEGSLAHVWNHREWVELVPNVQGRSVILRSVADRALRRTTYAGTDAYDNPIQVTILIVNEWARNAEGTLIGLRGAVFEEAQMDEAVAYFEGLTS